VGDCDRISVVRRKNVSDYLRNVLTIRTTRPPKPWHKLDDMSVFVLAERMDPSVEQLLRDIWSHCFYPYRIFLPLTAEELSRFKTVVPNVVPVQVSANDAIGLRLSKMLSQSDAPLATVLSPGITVPSGESMYIERSLFPLMNQKHGGTAFEIPESDDAHFGAAVYAAALHRAMQTSPADIRSGLLSAGIEVRKPAFKEYPFQFDNLLSAAELSQLDGDWYKAARIYDYLAEHYGNTLWMQVRQANALVQSGRSRKAAETIETVNRVRPTVASLLIAARNEKKQNRHREAIPLYQRALSILRGQTSNFFLKNPELQTSNYFEQHEETLVWT
jgi:hypothetical protein